MYALKRCTGVVAAIVAEAATMVLLVAIGRGSGLAVPVDHLGRWLRDGDPATVVVASLRCVALVGAGWLLASTLLYLLASLSRVPTAVRAVRWTTLASVRRAIDAACVLSVATSVAFVPTVAGAARADGPPVVTLVRDGRGGIARLPADPAAPPSTSTTRSRAVTTTPPSRPPSDRPTPLRADAPDASMPVLPVEVVVQPGDNLWVIAARRVAAATGRDVVAVGDIEIAPYWVRVCEANRDRLGSRDPNVVLPGERVLLPPLN